MVSVSLTKHVKWKACTQNDSTTTWGTVFTIAYQLLSSMLYSSTLLPEASIQKTLEYKIECAVGRFTVSVVRQPFGKFFSYWINQLLWKNVFWEKFNIGCVRTVGPHLFPLCQTSDGGLKRGSFTSRQNILTLWQFWITPYTNLDTFSNVDCCQITHQALSKA